MTTETRSIWLVTRAGVPVAWRWAYCARANEITPEMTDGRGPGYRCAAIDPGRNADEDGPEWDAVRSEFRGVPDLFTVGALEGGSPVLEVVAGKRCVRAHGLRLYLDDRGRARPQIKGSEPEAPDPEIADEAELIASLAAMRARRVAELDAHNMGEHGVPLPPLKRARLLGEHLDMIERGTLRPVRVIPVRPEGKTDEEVASLHPAGLALLAPGADGAPVRLEARSSQPAAPAPIAPAPGTKEFLNRTFPDRAALNAIVAERDAEIARLRAEIAAARDAGK